MEMRAASRTLSMAILLATALPVSAIADESEELQRYQVTISGVQLGEKERIVGFELRIKCGAVDSVVNLPVGWNYTIDDNMSWITQISGSIMVGAAAQDNEQIKNIHFTISKYEFSGMKFSVAGDVLATADYENWHRIPLRPNNLLWKTVGKAKPRAASTR